jgi:molybdopterin-guanine dinucleotide biosynthesis protein A
MKYSISAVILAGGGGRRLAGKPKTEIIIGGRKIISRMLDVISEIFDETFIVTNSPEIYSGIENSRIIVDIYNQSGPLGGIHAAMKASGKEALFVFAGDMPFLDKDLIINQIGRFKESDDSAIVPVLNDLEEPLHAIYRTSLLNEIEKLLEGPGTPAVKDFLKIIRAGYMILPSTPEILKAFTNINSHSDLERALE